MQRAGELWYAIYLVHFIWVGLFYSAGVAATRIQAITAFVQPLGSSGTGLASLLRYLIAVWVSATWLTDLVNKRLFQRRSKLASAEGNV